MRLLRKIRYLRGEVRAEAEYLGIGRNVIKFLLFKPYIVFQGDRTWLHLDEQGALRIDGSGEMATPHNIRRFWDLD